MPKVRNTVLIALLMLAAGATASAQSLTREIKLAGIERVEVTNNFGRVSVSAAGTKEKTAGELRATSSQAISDAEVKFEARRDRTAISVIPDSQSKRVDLVLTLPERMHIVVTTREGAVSIEGNFSQAEIVTETGTIAADVPTDNLTYTFRWLEARPRVLSDITLAPAKELSGGRFQVKGSHKTEREDAVVKTPADDKTEIPKETSREVELDFTTGRGIVLLNVPPSEVGSDLRERPLTNAAKAIIRSGDSLLMEAIRRAAPKYFGDYSKTLPPIRLEPRLRQREAEKAEQTPAVKTALVRVTDLENRAVTDLAPGDFEVAEGGGAREIVSVRPSDAPFNLVLLLDVSGSIENYVNFIRKTARNFVDTVDERDKISIVIFNEDVKVLSGFTTDKLKLSESLDTFDAGGGTAYYDALAFTVADTLRPIKGERSAIVILTDGDDNRSFLAFDSLIGSIQESGALIYPLYVPSGLIAAAANGTAGDIDPLRKRYMSLSAKTTGEGERLAKISGGVYYPITEIGQIQRAYRDIVSQLRSGYEVTYRSSNSTEGISPKLKIKARRSGTFTAIQNVTLAKN
jgi:VWFA-related protein